MGTIRDIKRRITSVGNIRQITRAMKMVATSKLRRYESQMRALRPYADRLLEVISRLLPQLSGDEHPLLQKREPRNVGFLVITGDKGLCGSFNANILRKAGELLDQEGGDTPHVISIGRKALSFYRRRGIEPDLHYIDIYDRLHLTTAAVLSDHIVDYYIKGRFDCIYFIYSEFISILNQRVVAAP